MFRNRADRLDLSFPLEFEADGMTLRGTCLNISDSGLLGVFGDPPELWTKGLLRLHFGDGVSEMPARVARVRDREVGLAFSFRDQADREVIRAILAFAEANTHLVGRPPF